MGLFDIFKKKTPSTPKESLSKKANTSEDEYLDDVTFILDMKHNLVDSKIGKWHQYDVLVAARGYGWDMMIHWADYMADADLDHINYVVTGYSTTHEIDVSKSYIANGCRCKNTPELETEMAYLIVGGISRILLAPLKIIWTNQTRVFTLQTLVDDDLLIKKYVETMIRCTFNTENAMKLGKPIPEGQ